MAGKALQFLKKLNELPEEVGLYFDSVAETEASKEVEKDFQLSSASLSDLVRDIFIANFDFSVLDNNLKATNVPTPSQSKLAADILGKLFLPVASFLNLDIKAEIIKRGHRPEL